MSREIKFRAWDGERMLNRTLFDRNWYNSDDKCVCGARPEDGARFKVMQYTGLKDKNGTEIYEGDKVSAGGRCGVVEFDTEFGAGYIRREVCDDGTGFVCGLYGCDQNIYKVIGNIYE